MWAGAVTETNHIIRDSVNAGKIDHATARAVAEAVEAGIVFKSSAAKVGEGDV